MKIRSKSVMYTEIRCKVTLFSVKNINIFAKILLFLGYFEKYE